MIPTRGKSKHVLVIGAGPGGLTAALLLAHRGFRVTVVEQHPFVGGRNSELKFDGFSFDLGPTFLHQKFCLDEIFAETGGPGAEPLEFVNLNPMTRLTWGDTSLHTYSDIARMTAEIERVFPGSSDGFHRYMRDHGKKFRTIYPCLQRPYQTLASYLSPNLLRALPYVLSRRCVHDVLGDYFSDERLKLAFTFQAKYLGMSPWHCPALFSILSFTEYRYGVYHVQGGLNRISRAMAARLLELGGELRLAAPVRRVCFNGRHATGAELQSGETIPADAVVINADYGHAATKLLGEHNIAEAKMLRRKFSCSTFMLYLGLDTVYRHEPHHHVIFADDYHQNVADIQSERRVSRDMSIYVRNSSVIDPHVAPPGMSGIYVLVPTINTRHGFDWEGHQEEFAERILQRIEQRTSMKDLRRRIVTRRIISPLDWRAADVFLGATFNLAHTLGQMLYMRPHNRYRHFHNLYLAGGGTHPGSGLPTIYESGRISANLICQQFGVPFQPVDLAAEYLRNA